MGELYPSSFQENETSNQLGRGDWSDVILPAIPSELFTQQMSYVIRGLEPGSQYEARVRARNRFGWNELSEQFHFSTRGSDPNDSLFFIQKTRKVDLQDS
ncbi:hypothetical protein RUM43_008568 [Polyplax serrata]|uniref:Fibronectin type-III domain-containing protein n=1 Tax=Polyplax serrata TaxID=468196 RepID=A0AAN8NTT9_POLSC